MAKESEETTKGLTAGKLKDIEGYPSDQNIKVDIAILENGWHVLIFYVQMELKIIQKPGLCRL